MLSLDLLQGEAGIADLHVLERRRLEAQVAARDGIAIAQQHRTLQYVAQLTDIAGPGVAAQRLLGVLAQPHAPAGSIGQAREQRPGERGDVFLTLTQRGHAQRNAADSEIQVAAECPLLHLAGKVLVGGGDQPDVDLPLAYRAQAAKALFLQYLEQLGLHTRIDIADFVEEDRAAIGDFEDTRLARGCPGEGALLMTEQLGFQEVRRQPRAIQIDEGLVGAWAVKMQPLRQQALAGAGLPQNENRTVAAHHLVDLLGQRANGRALAEQRVDPLALLAGHHDPLLALQPPVVQQALEDGVQRGHLDRLGEKLLRALLDRLYGQVDRAVGRQNDHRHVRLEPSEIAQQVQRAAVMQPIVDDRDVRRRGLEQLPGALAAVGIDDAIASRLQEAAHAEADAVLVVDDQYSGSCHSPSPQGRAP